MVNKTLLVIITLLSFQLALANTELENTIEHLLAEIKASNCTFYRNNKAYQAPDVITHIKRKHEYFRKKIKNTQDFIRLAATKSELSGKLYLIECQDGKEPLGEWLTRKLQ